ncbi:MAG: hypothetical protein HXX17_07800 [Geobacteraceae bacterium]|nr:hypothetical protein [Geobacteraceae bacterium]
MKRVFIAALMIFILQIAINAYCASVQVVSGGSGVYYLKGFDFVDIGGVEIVIQYDTSALSNPRVAAGSSLASTMFFPNAKYSASSVKIVAATLSPIKSGDLATITFDVKGDNPPDPYITMKKLATVTAANVPLETPAATISGNTSNTDTNNQTTNPSSNPTVNPTVNPQTNPYGSTPSIGSLTLPQDLTSSPSTPSTERKSDSQPLVTDLRKDMTLPLGDSAGQQMAAEQKSEREKAPEKKSVAYKSTLQLFREFKEEKTPKSLIALFAEVSMPGFAQNPPIVIADGETPVKITLVMRQTENESPKFMLNGAKTLNLSGEGEDVITWTIEALPKKGAVEAVLTVIDGKAVMEFPLTVVPSVSPVMTKGKALSEADFNTYLAGKFDLNKDGKFDAVDDYIYTANYIAAMKIKPQKAAKEEAVKPDAKGDAKSKEKQPVKP